MRLEQEPENTRLMRIKYEEKQAEKLFIEEQKAVENKLFDFNTKNKEHLKETEENYKKIKNSDNKVINANQEARQKELEEIEKLSKQLDFEKTEKAKSEAEKNIREEEKSKLEFELKQLSIYEHFLKNVMLASEEQEKDEKPKDAIKKMIDRYERLKTKQNDLKIDLDDKEKMKVPIK